MELFKNLSLYNNSFILFKLLFIVLLIIFSVNSGDIIVRTQKKFVLRYFSDKYLITKVLKMI